MISFATAEAATAEVSAKHIASVRALSGKIRELLGMDFEIIDTVVSVGSTITFLRLDLQGQNLNLSEYQSNYSNNMYGSQTGDVLIVDYDDSMYLYIDLGESTQQRGWRDYHYIPLY